MFNLVKSFEKRHKPCDQSDFSLRAIIKVKYSLMIFKIQFIFGSHWLTNQKEFSTSQFYNSLIFINVNDDAYLWQIDPGILAGNACL